MSFAQQQWDGLVNDVRRYNDVKEIDSLLSRWREACQSWKDDSAAWQLRAETAEARMLAAENEVCGGFALQIALEQFVSKCYPTHPFLQDKQLRARIYEAGVRAGNLANSYGAAREAGRTFAMPAEVLAPLIGTREERNNLDEKLLAEQRKNVDLSAQLAVAGSTDKLQAELQRVIRDCAHHMAQSAAFREQLTQVDPENPLVLDGSLRRRIADEAYTQLERNGGSDWDVVKEVGRTFAIPGRHVAGAYHGDHDLVHEVGLHSDLPASNSDELHEPPEHLAVVGVMDDPVGFLQARDPSDHVDQVAHSDHAESEAR